MDLNSLLSNPSFLVHKRLLVKTTEPNELVVRLVLAFDNMNEKNNQSKTLVFTVLFSGYEEAIYKQLF